MKSNKLLLSVLLIFIAFGANAQDVIVSINDYSTEQDYNEKNNIEPLYEVYGHEVEEIYEDEHKPKRRRNTLAAEIAAEVFVEVLVNTVFIIATFWN